MPTRQRVEDFVAMVVSNKHVEVIEEFYHADASMQENFHPARKGKDNLLSFEAEFLEKIQAMESSPPHKVLVDGDNVAIHWTFEIVDPLGQRRRIEEVSLQRWQDEMIIEERFFYDSAMAWQPVE